MHTIVLAASASDTIARALEILRAGGLVAFPTDTVYGLGCRVFDGQGVQSIYNAKDRPVEKAIPVLLGDPEDLEKVAINIPISARRLAARFWPGPLTILVPKKSELPEAVSATKTVGVRMPDHSVARSLLRAAGPMAVTSANMSGQVSSSTAEDVLAQLNGRIPLIIDGGKTPGGMPSTVVDCNGEKISVLREGPITEVQLISAV
jgi:L-threonylcarbamoyladenylate synthase